MKPKLLLLFVLPILLACGCAGAPNAVEKEFFNIESSLVPIVTWETNVVQLQSPTGPILQTNVASVTNWFEALDFTPNENAQAVVETGTNIGNFFGMGGIVGTLLSLTFGVWAKLRSNTNRKTAGILAQVIEAGRKVMGTTPQGKQLESQWVAWMSKRQTETGVVLEVSKLIKQVVDKESAQLVADELIKMTQKVQPPAPKPPPKK